MALTDSQKALKMYLRGYIDASGVIPEIPVIARQLKISEKSVDIFIKQLFIKGELFVTPEKTVDIKDRLPCLVPFNAGKKDELWMKVH